MRLRFTGIAYPICENHGQFHFAIAKQAKRLDMVIHNVRTAIASVDSWVPSLLRESMLLLSKLSLPSFTLPPPKKNIIARRNKRLAMVVAIWNLRDIIARSHKQFVAILTVFARLKSLITFHSNDRECRLTQRAFSSSRDDKWVLCDSYRNAINERLG